jgi:hypothetical protein
VLVGVAAIAVGLDNIVPSYSAELMQCDLVADAIYQQCHPIVLPIGGANLVRCARYDLFGSKHTILDEARGRAVWCRLSAPMASKQDPCWSRLSNGCPSAL